MNTSHSTSSQIQLATTRHERSVEATKEWSDQQHGSQDVREQEFQSLYQENLSLIYRYIYSKVGNHEEAEDLTSQTFTKAVRGLDSERSRLSMQKWLFQVARTTIADYWRVYYRVSVSSLEALLDEGWEGPADASNEDIGPESTSPAERVQQILAGLPVHYREVLQCRFLLNLSIKETALHMGLSEANVKVLQFRALKRAAGLEPMITGLGSATP